MQREHSRRAFSGADHERLPDDARPCFATFPPEIFPCPRPHHLSLLSRLTGLLARIYEVLPLRSPAFGSEIRRISLVSLPSNVERSLLRLDPYIDARSYPPPEVRTSPAPCHPHSGCSTQEQCLTRPLIVPHLSLLALSHCTPYFDETAEKPFEILTREIPAMLKE